MLIALDSNVFIAVLSPNEADAPIARELAKQIAQGKHQVVMSSIVYGEVLALLKSVASEQPLDITLFFSSLKHLTSLPANDSRCLAAGQLRQRWGKQLKLPDAIHLATAIDQKVELFITNDLPLAKLARNTINTKTLAEFSKMNI